MATLNDLVVLTQEIKNSRSHGTEYSGMGTAHDQLVDELIEEGHKWPELNALIHKAYNEADYMA